MKFGGLKSIIYSMNGWNMAQVPGGWCGFRTVGDKTFVLDVDNVTNNKTLGTYSLTSNSAYGGLITVELEIL